MSSVSTNGIWGDHEFRLFLSHKSEVKEEAAKLAADLKTYGVSAFVAHEDIQPTKAWQDEIENALASMDGFVALLTGGFHDSEWTDQEVGFALARGVPMIAVRMGLNPYGFIAKFQALTCDWTMAAKEIVRLLIDHPRMIDGYISGVRNCESFAGGNRLAEILPDIQDLDEEQVDHLVLAYNENGQARYSFAFEGSRPYNFGPGLLHYLHRLSKRRFHRVAEGRIEVDP